jgi:hypothetical protein
MPGPHKCTNPVCGKWNTVTHYFHTKDGTPHHFEIPNPQPPPPPPPPVTSVPQPQPCPIDGCPMLAPNQPKGNPIFTYCLDCGNIEPH